MKVLSTLMTVGIAQLELFGPNRLDMARNDILDLANNILSVGMINPIQVRPKGNDPSIVGSEDAVYEVISGHRRMLACEELGFSDINATVIEANDNEALIIRYSENTHRKDLTIFEEIQVVKACVETGVNYKDIGDKLGKTSAWVARRVNLLNLIPEWMDEMNLREDTPDWTIAHYETIARYPADQQAQIRDSVPYYIEQSDDVADLKDWLKAFECSFATMPWDIDDDTMAPGACTTCHQRAGFQPDLFDTLDTDPEKDRCLNPACYREKMKAHILATHAAMANRAEDTNQPVYLIASFGSSGLSDDDIDCMAGEVLRSGQYRLLGDEAPDDPTRVVHALMLGGGQAGRIVPVELPPVIDPPVAGENDRECPAPVRDEGVTRVQRERIVNRRHKRIIESVAGILKAEINELSMVKRIDPDKLLSVIPFFACRSVSRMRNEETGYTEYLSFADKFRHAATMVHPDHTTLIHMVFQNMLPDWLEALDTRLRTRDYRLEEATLITEFLEQDWRAIVAETETAIELPKSWGPFDEADLYGDIDGEQLTHPERFEEKPAESENTPEEVFEEDGELVEV